MFREAFFAWWRRRDSNTEKLPLIPLILTYGAFFSLTYREFLLPLNFFVIIN